MTRYQRRPEDLAILYLHLQTLGAASGPKFQGFTINQHGSKQSSTGNPSSKESFFRGQIFQQKVLCEFGLFYGLVLMESTVR